MPCHPLAEEQHGESKVVHNAQVTASAQVRQAIRSAPVAASERVGVACSGGRDSIVLLAAVAEVLFSRGIPVRAVHVHHDLRGAASDADATLVRRTARRLGIPCSVQRAPVAAGPGLEARAREARYEAFARVARRHGLTALLLAHHADDQAETVVMRVLRGAGARGLRGMPRVRPLSGGCRILRPLLALRRKDLEAAATEGGLEWRDDQSNRDRRFLRNLVRHDVLPALRGGHERALSISRRAEAAYEALDAASRLLASEIVRIQTPVFAAFDAPALRELPDALAFHVVENAAPRALTGAAWAALRPVLAGGPAATLEGPLDASLTGEALWLAARAAPQESQPLTVPGTADVPALAWRVEAAGRATTRLTLRCWRPGDRIGRATVASLLKRMGVPPIVRPHYPIVCDGNGPVWVAGVLPHNAAGLELRVPSRDPATLQPWS
ncbi:MAG: tRNA lysidine(34) synthetase TilS [Planctomycetes bacterium]|nr:tRNA lysidine(34) synthetase TilS [Planctomycetota bacterium]